ncbi:MAG TPA: hypothetical protein VKQ32_02675 [Polyangia bacterium]|nr:hypothetical protein [Polyangia bacterium]
MDSRLFPAFFLLLGAALEWLARRSARQQRASISAYRAAAVSAVALAILGAFTVDRTGPIWDSETYFRMAAGGGLLNGGLAPFCFRILTPAIARLVPMRLAVSFELINQVSLWAAGTLVYWLLRARGLRHETALVGPCVLILSSFSKFVLWYRFGVDQLALLAIVAVAWALAERRIVVAALLATIAVLGKESILLVAPFAYGELRTAPRLRRNLALCVLATLAFWAAAIVGFVVLRMTIPHSAGEGSIAQTISNWARARLGSPKGFCELTLAVPKTFGVMPLLMVLSGRRTLAIVRREPYAAATVVTFLLAGIFGAADYERVYFLAIPFVLMICLPLLETSQLSPKEVVAMVAAHVSLLDVFSPPTFLDLPRWFMTNARWPDLAAYAAKVALWTVVLKIVGIGSTLKPQGDGGWTQGGASSKPTRAV